jgi:uncharacterized protein YecA (UPF0149 family)
MTTHLPVSLPCLMDSAQDLTLEPLSADQFAALEAILTYLRTRHDGIPKWEFCEGFMAALICCRRQIPPKDYLPVLLAVPFANAVQRQHFTYNMREMWRTLGPRIETVVKPATLGRNDPCACGSGKKVQEVLL